MSLTIRYDFQIPNHSCNSFLSLSNFYHILFEVWMQELDTVSSNSLIKAIYRSNTISLLLFGTTLHIYLRITITHLATALHWEFCSISCIW